MKKLEVIIKAEKFEAVKTVLNEQDIHGMMITNIMGFGNQKGYTQTYRGTKTTVNLLPKIKLEIVISDDKVEPAVKAITKTAATGNFGDGKIFIYNVEDAIRIRTGEHGESAI